MPLYELFCIAAHNARSPLWRADPLPTSTGPRTTRGQAQPIALVVEAAVNLRQLTETLARQIHSAGGVVRDLQNLGVGLTLPTRMRASQQYHTRGDHFAMRFDLSPPALKSLQETLRADPGVVRWTVLKKGEAVKDLGVQPTGSIFNESTSARSLL